jgi:hypothetical protein
MVLSKEWKSFLIGGIGLVIVGLFMMYLYFILESGGSGMFNLSIGDFGIIFFTFGIILLISGVILKIK